MVRRKKLANILRGSGIVRSVILMNSSSNSKLLRSFVHIGCRFFRQGGIDEHAGADFKSRDGRQTWNVPNVPQKIGLVFIFDGSGMKHEVIVRIVEVPVNLREDCFEGKRKMFGRLGR